MEHALHPPGTRWARCLSPPIKGTLISSDHVRPRKQGGKRGGCQALVPFLRRLTCHGAWGPLRQELWSSSQGSSNRAAVQTLQTQNIARRETKSGLQILSMHSLANSASYTRDTEATSRSSCTCAAGLAVPCAPWLGAYLKVPLSPPPFNGDEFLSFPTPGLQHWVRVSRCCWFFNNASPKGTEGREATQAWNQPLPRPPLASFRILGQMLLEVIRRMGSILLKATIGSQDKDVSHKKATNLKIMPSLPFMESERDCIF